MAEMTTTTSLNDLKTLFNQMKEVNYIKTPNTTLAALAAFDMELPVLSDGVTFDTGAADVTKIKLTTGATWTAVADAGDADIQFQVASAADPINELLLNKKTESAAMTATIGGVTYEGSGFNIEPKKVTGGLFMRSEDKQTALFLPNIEAYSHFVSERGKPGYYNLVVSPLNDASGAAIYILKAKASE